MDLIPAPAHALTLIHPANLELIISLDGFTIVSFQHIILFILSKFEWLTHHSNHIIKISLSRFSKNKVIKQYVPQGIAGQFGQWLVKAWTAYGRP